MKMTISLAGIPVAITTMYPSLPPFAAQYATDETPAFSVETDEADIRFEEKKSREEAAYEGIPYAEYTPAQLESTAVYRKIANRLPDFDAFVFHGSAVAVGDKAFLFTARSGTGKTTHTNLWLKNVAGSFVVNGDKPILRVKDGVPYVCGTPWMGKEDLGCNRQVPLQAIAFVNRSADNRIERADFSRMLPRLIGQTYRPPDGVMLAKTVRLIGQIAHRAGLYDLFCNMNDDAALVAFRGMNEEDLR